MPVYAQQTKIVRPRERLTALAAVVVVQLGLGFVLLNGLHVSVSRSRDIVEQLVSVTLPKAPPPPQPPPKPIQGPMPLEVQRVLGIPSPLAPKPQAAPSMDPSMSS